LLNWEAVAIRMAAEIGMRFRHAAWVHTSRGRRRGGTNIGYGRQQIDHRGSRFVLPIQAKARIAEPFRADCVFQSGTRRTGEVAAQAPGRKVMKFQGWTRQAAASDRAVSPLEAPVTRASLPRRLRSMSLCLVKNVRAVSRSRRPCP
jgi:hypothetical protein